MKRIRTRRRKLLAPTSLALLVALIPALAAAQPTGQGGHGRFMERRPFMGSGPHTGQGPMFERIVERLDLTSEQQEAIREVRQSFREQLRLAFREVQATQRALRQQIHTEVFDETAIREAANDLGMAEAEVAVIRGLIVQEIRGLLTPEQREEIEQWHQKRRELMQERAARFLERTSESER